MLPGQLPAQSRHVRIHPLTLLLRKRRQIIPIALQRVCNLICRLGIAQLQDGVVVKRPVLRLLVLAPEFLALDAKDLHSDAARRGRVVGHDFGRERRVAHDYVVGAWFGEHALGEVSGEVVVDDEFAHYALEREGVSMHRFVTVNVFLQLTPWVLRCVPRRQCMCSLKFII